MEQKPAHRVRYTDAWGVRPRLSPTQSLPRSEPAEAGRTGRDKGPWPGRERAGAGLLRGSKDPQREAVVVPMAAQVTFSSTSKNARERGWMTQGGVAP